MLLGVTNSGNCIIGSKNPILKQEDIKGLKIRAYGPIAKALDKLGATPVAISYGEIYESAQRGTIDGFSGVGFGGVYGMKFHEVCPHILDPGFGNYCQVIVMMGKQWWNDLPDDIKQTMKEIVKDWPDAQNRLQLEKEKEWAVKIKAEGGHLNALSASELTKWRNAVVPSLWNEWVTDMEKRGVKNAKEFLDLYVQANKKWEPQNPYVLWYEQVK
jgi:TRAP-type C4-dicarboxylate transport system substrate-binding protein